MPEKTAQAKKISMSSTKTEMLEVYNAILGEMREKEKSALRPDEEIEKKRKKEAVDLTDGLSSDGVVKEVNALKAELGKILISLSEQLEEEVSKYRKVKEAIEVKEKELDEIYGIQKEAQSLVVLIEVQSQKRQEFEKEMADKREEWNRQLQKMRAEQDEERKLYEVRVKEQDAEGLRLRQRTKEEFDYAFKREQQLARNKFEDEKAKQEKELELKKEQVERQLAEREKNLTEQEERVKELQEEVDNSPKEIDAAIQKAVKETTEKLQSEARNREELLKKSFEGEKNVLLAKLESLEKTAKEQKEQITKLSQALEKAYQQVEDIAVKTVGGAFDLRAITTSQQQRAGESTKKQSQEQ